MVNTKQSPFSKTGVKSNHLSRAMTWRCIGPFRGGRVIAVAGHPTNQSTFFFGSVAGGVWKTTDAGTYWKNISDPYFTTSSVGAIAISESDPNVIYVGTGECCIRNNVTHGDGVYKSTDGGETWSNTGLFDTRHIARIRIHPNNPDLVYVAALGHAFGPNKERGIYRSVDGGNTWEQILFKSSEAGAIDLSMDPSNPRILYASTWEAQRSFWDIVSGGPGSGIFKTTDGGDTWTDLSQNPGLPKETIGRIGISASPAKPGRVWAIIEAEHGGVFRSDDGGDTWQELANDDVLRERSWYYTHVFADPVDSETVWVLSTKVSKSTDGGRTFSQIPMPHGDQHDLWIDPTNPDRIINGNDGGATISLNGGDTWSNIYNQPTAQFYHIVTDNRSPYYVYGTQQDNSGVAVRSHSDNGAILTSDWYNVGMSESGDIAVKPDDPNIVYSAYPFGILNRYDHRNAEVRVVTVWPEDHSDWAASTFKYRFAWKFPIVFSPHDSNTLYVGANVMLKTTDDGTSWQVISPDLTRNDKTKLELKGGPITIEGAEAEVYCTVYAFAESAIQKGLLWAGSDDGLIHLSTDGGNEWNNVTPKSMPEWTMIHSIEPSPHNQGTCYIAATRYKLDDYKPYLYKTDDFGKNWVEINSGIPENDFTRVIREDPSCKGLLYCGTETGVYVSHNNGDSWESLQSNLPVVPIHDMVVQDNDLVVGTHGRSMWILDDITPLQQLAKEPSDGKPFLAKPRPTYRRLSQAPTMDEIPPGMNYVARILGVPMAFYEEKSSDGETTRLMLDAGDNPPDGVRITFYIPDDSINGASLIILDSEKNPIQSFSNSEDPNTLKVQKGTNSFIWNMKYPGAVKLSDDPRGYTPKELNGILAPPGSYYVQLKINSMTIEQPFTLIKDPRSSALQSDLDEQFDLLRNIRDRLSEVHKAANMIRNLDSQLQGWISRAEAQGSHKEIIDTANSIRDSLAEIEINLVAMKPPPGSLRGEVVRLNGKLVTLAKVVSSADWAPTKQSYEVLELVSKQIDSNINSLKDIQNKEISSFGELIKRSELPPIYTGDFQ